MLERGLSTYKSCFDNVFAKNRACIVDILPHRRITLARLGLKVTSSFAATSGQLRNFLNVGKLLEIIGANFQQHGMEVSLRHLLQDFGKLTVCLPEASLSLCTSHC
jgi:hypothetical protein